MASSWSAKARMRGEDPFVSPNFTASSYHFELALCQHIRQLKLHRLLKRMSNDTGCGIGTP